MIKIHFDGEKYAPKIVCDSCFGGITNIGLACVVHPNFLEKKGVVSPWFAHKSCRPALNKLLKRQGHTPGWMELRKFLEDLNFNADLNANLKD